MAYRRLVKEVYRRLPNILYFDDFNDRVPDEILFDAEYAKTGKLTSSGAKREWQEIVVEVFRRALGGEMSLAEFFKTAGDEDEFENNIADVAAALNDEIISEWDKLRESHADFVDPGDSSLELKLSCSPSDGVFAFKFKVVDKKCGGARRQFDVTERSKGFQWFFNFIVKLKFNPKYDENPRDAIYLLDEPGSYLHSSAQKELLAKLVEISESNTIVFCTHSQYLLDPERINVGDIKIVSREGEAVRVCSYGESGGRRDLGAYSALYDALKLKFGFPIQELSSVLLTEGVSDYCFCRLFLELPGVTVVPGAGCTQLRQLISVLSAVSDRFLVLLDKDEEGGAAYRDYEKSFGGLFTRNAYRYDDFAEGRVTPERILDSSDIARIESATGCEDVKKALIQLHYSSEELKGEVISGLSGRSRERLAVLEKALAGRLS